MMHLQIAHQVLRLGGRQSRQLRGQMAVQDAIAAAVKQRVEALFNVAALRQIGVDIGRRDVHKAAYVIHLLRQLCCLPGGLHIPGAARGLACCKSVCRESRHHML